MCMYVCGMVMVETAREEGYDKATQSIVQGRARVQEKTRQTSEVWVGGTAFGTSHKYVDDRAVRDVKGMIGLGDESVAVSLALCSRYY